MAADSFSTELVDVIPSLRAYARALTRNAADCDDLVQETLAKALKYHDRYESGTRLKSWLFTIMRNTFYTATKKSARERPGLEDCVAETVLVDPVHDAVITHKRLLAAIERLPRQYREMLILVVMLGETYEDAASICGCAVGTVKSRVNRARRMVMQEMEDGAAQPRGKAVLANRRLDIAAGFGAIRRP